jgi:hypothetical protein
MNNNIIKWSGFLGIFSGVQTGNLELLVLLLDFAHGACLAPAYFRSRDRQNNLNCANCQNNGGVINIGPVDTRRINLAYCAYFNGPIRM